MINDYTLWHMPIERFIDISGWVMSAASLIGVIFNIYKSKWGFFIWALTDIGWAAISMYYSIYSQAVMFVIMLVFAIYGFMKCNSTQK
jgi:hypothetical protein